MTGDGINNKNEISIRSAATVYLTYIASSGDISESMELRYEARIFGSPKSWGFKVNRQGLHY